LMWFQLVYTSGQALFSECGSTWHLKLVDEPLVVPGHKDRGHVSRWSLKETWKIRVHNRFLQGVPCTST
jgi:hypothetical protein